MLAGAVLLAGCAHTLTVGPHDAYRLPSDAAAAARAGDTILIAGGDYSDCAVWKADDLTIVAQGPVTIDGPVCGGKGLFVIQGRDTMVRGITFAHARSADGNGAGIRMEGRGLTVEDSAFLGNEDGILATVSGGEITVRKSRFEGNGTCANKGGCAHGIYITQADVVRIEDSVFRGQREGHHIKSRARRTEVTGNIIEDGSDGTASYLVDVPDGGTLVMRNNTLRKGVHAGDRRCAVPIGEESLRNPTKEIIADHNRFTNDLPFPVIFLCNETSTVPQLNDNEFSGQVVPTGVPRKQN